MKQGICAQRLVYVLILGVLQFIFTILHIYIFMQEDLYCPHPFIQDIIWATIDKIMEPILMKWPCKKIREKALQRVMEHIHYEDENTQYICISSVNKVSKSCRFLYDFLSNFRILIILASLRC